MLFEDAFRYCCLDCPSCPANDIKMGQVTCELWVAIMKYGLKCSCIETDMTHIPQMKENFKYINQALSQEDNNKRKKFKVSKVFFCFLFLI